jgi:hypothetical protein
MLGCRRFREFPLRHASVLIFAVCLTLPATAWSQDAALKLDLTPLFATLHHKDWAGNNNGTLADAIQAAFSQAQFQTAAGPGADVLTLSIPDGVKKNRDEYSFTLVFSRDGAQQGEAAEYCAVTKLSDCTGQMVLDTKTAAQP